jgi:cyanophycinase
MPGTLFAIGGAEARMRRRSVLDAFVASAGGTQARIAVVSSASSLGVEVVEVYRGVFTSLGAGQVISLRPESRAEAHDPDLVEQLRTVSAVFLTGGNQLKLSSFITGTPFGEAIKEANERGTVVAGTSAGASILAEHMIAFGTGGATPKQRMSQLSAGLGLLRGVVIDQHFEQRNRYGRLLSLVAQSPSLLGLGVDEDTAAVIDDGSRLEVIGRGCRHCGRRAESGLQRLRGQAHVSATGVWGGAARATCWEPIRSHHPYLARPSDSCT